jgi:hypothetical protein
MAAKKSTKRIAQSFDIDPKKLKEQQKKQKLYNKGKGTDNPYEKEIFLKRTGPQLPMAKKPMKKRNKMA